jgi:hypothetical protein
MAHVSADRVRDTSTSTGTGTFVVSGTAPTAFRTFSAVLSTNDTFYYAIQHQTANEWEIGLGTYSSANTITRTTVYASSAGGSAVTFSSGTKDVFITLAADRSVQLDNNGAIPGITDAGDLTFTGTGRRITGDMSNATHANRLSFQTSVTNGATNPFFIPNGAGTTAGVVVANSSDPTNSSYGQIVAVGSTDIRLISALLGTGSYLPMTFHTGGSERMRVDTSGNLAIGSASALVRLDVTGEARFASTANWNFSGINVVRNASNTSTPRLISMPLNGDSLSDTTIGGYNAIWGVYNASPTTGSTSASLQGEMAYGAYYGHRWYTNGTERMRIDSSGNVGIGTSSPQQKLHVSGSGSTYTQTSSSNAGTGAGAFYKNATATWLIGAGPASGGSEFAFVDQTSGSLERMRIDSSGNLSVGGTNNPARFNYIFNGLTTVGAASVDTSNSGTTAAFRFFRNTTTQVGEIATTTSGTSYNSSSDYRLKRDVQPLTSGLTTIAALKPSTYKWNADDSNGEGFIAHELAEHIPLAVTGEKDAVNEDGSIKPQGVDYSKIVVHLVAAIQELSAKVAALEGK